MTKKYKYEVGEIVKRNKAAMSMTFPHNEYLLKDRGMVIKAEYSETLKVNFYDIYWMISQKALKNFTERELDKIK